MKRQYLREAARVRVSLRLRIAPRFEHGVRRGHLGLDLRRRALWGGGAAGPAPRLHGCALREIVDNDLGGLRLARAALAGNDKGLVQPHLHRLHALRLLLLSLGAHPYRELFRRRRGERKTLVRELAKAVRVRVGRVPCLTHEGLLRGAWDALARVHSHQHRPHVGVGVVQHKALVQAVKDRGLGQMQQGGQVGASRVPHVRRNDLIEAEVELLLLARLRKALATLAPHGQVLTLHIEHFGKFPHSVGVLLDPDMSPNVELLLNVQHHLLFVAFRHVECLCMVCIPLLSTVQYTLKKELP
mmetsp:Transcript_60803/g.166981  ORF Transcript_60803/g.166981 Transcript_60803/m.166981 type:complete len:300 (+) Transcript_60803:812-1711(+)